MIAGTIKLEDASLAEPAGAVSLSRLEWRIVSGAEWDSSIAGFEGVVLEQVHAFACGRWRKVRHEPVLFFEGDEPVGGALVMVQSMPLNLSALAICKWGPILKNNARPDRSAIYAEIVDALVAEYADRRGMMISVMPRAAVGPDNSELSHLLSRGFRRGWELPYPARYIVDLRLEDAEQRASFHQKWRYHLKKAEKAGLTFERAAPQQLQEFDLLYRAMTERKRFPDYSAYETLPDLMKAQPAELQPELFFVRHEGEIVAGAIIFKAGDTAVYLYGATNHRALPLRAGYFLHWHIIRWLRDNTPARWYDLGGTDGFHGLHQFKKGMVGEAGVISTVPPVADFASRPTALVIGSIAYFARDMGRWAKRQLAGIKGLARPEGQGANGGD